MTHKLKKTTRLMLLIGAFCMAFPMLTRSFMETPEGLGDFLKGFGVAVMIGALVLERWKRTRAC